MRLPLCLLSLLLPSLSTGATPTPPPPPPQPQSTTLVDVLSSDSDFTLLLRLLQRAKLVPTLNTLNGSTLLAPTNDAIKRYQNRTSSLWSYAFDDSPDPLVDNVQEALRQHLFYHLLNYTLTEADITSDVTIQETLHYPTLVLTEPPTDEPPPQEPWLPIPGGLLGKESQRLRTARRDGDSIFFGVNALGAGGSKHVKEVIKADNGLVYPLDDVLALPGSLLEEARKHPRLTLVSRLLSDEMEEALKVTPHMTLFLPVDEAWDALDPIERRYLESGFAQKDMEKIVQLHASVNGPGSSEGHSRVGWSQNWKTNGTTKFATLRDHTLHLSTTSDPPSIGNASIIDQDVYASNGVLHTVSSLLLDPSIFQLNAEKYLLALNATQFVGLLRLANLSSYVDDDAKPWTILAPQDTVVSSLLKANETDLERILRYHFIPGKLKPEELKDKQLLETELKEDGLKGARQVVQVSVKGGKSASTGGGDVGFGESLVLGDAVEIGDSIIYLLSSPLDPPSDVISSLLPSLSYTTFLTSIYSTNLAETIASHPLTTVLVPHNDAWKTLGLVADHLLTAKDALRKVILHHVLQGVIYPGDEVIGLESSSSSSFATLEGSDVWMHNGKVTASGGWPTPASSPIRVRHRETATFTRTGTTYALHNGVLLPRSVQITVEDLALAGKASIMLSLIRKAGLGGALNGTLEMDWDDHEYDDGILEWWWMPKKKGRKGEKVGWTLLCPTDEGFKGMNLTALKEDQNTLVGFVKQHLIPVSTGDLATAAATASRGRSWFDFFQNKKPSEGEDNSGVDPSMPLPVMDDASFSTLLSPSASHGDVVFRALGGDKERFLVGIKGVRGGLIDTEYAHVLKWGRTTSVSPHTPPSSPPPHNITTTASDQFPFRYSLGDDNNSPALRSGVVLIDRPLVPYTETWWITWGQAVILGAFAAVFMQVGFFWVVRWFKAKESEATYEPIGRGAGGEDE